MDDFEAHPAGMADLVKRLREKQICTGFEQVEPGVIDCVYGSDPVCQDAADRIEQLEAALTRANAATATAYEVAAEIADLAEHDAQECDWRSGANQADVIAKRIRALATPDQTAALDKLIADAVKPYVEALENIAQEASVPIHTWQNGINFKRMYEGWRKIATERIDTARAILAASKKGGV